MLGCSSLWPPSRYRRRPVVQHHVIDVGKVPLAPAASIQAVPEIRKGSGQGRSHTPPALRAMGTTSPPACTTAIHNGSLGGDRCACDASPQAGQTAIRPASATHHALSDLPRSHPAMLCSSVCVNQGSFLGTFHVNTEDDGPRTVWTTAWLVDGPRRDYVRIPRTQDKLLFALLDVRCRLHTATSRKTTGFWLLPAAGLPLDHPHSADTRGRSGFCAKDLPLLARSP